MGLAVKQRKKAESIAMGYSGVNTPPTIPKTSLEHRQVHFGRRSVWGFASAREHTEARRARKRWRICARRASLPGVGAHLMNVDHR